MIATWMLAATLFAALLGVAAMAAEGVARTLGREARGTWIAALTAAVGWPAAAPAFASAFARFTAGPANGPASLVPTSFATIAAVMPTAPKAWIVYTDVALVALWALTSTVLFIRLIWAMRILSRLERRPNATSSTAFLCSSPPRLAQPCLARDACAYSCHAGCSNLMRHSARWS
jgi:hypothetical protein